MSETKKRPFIIGVSGGSGSGNTSVSHAIYDDLAGMSIRSIAQDTYNKDQT